jgi:NAD(P)-dependent dehydrogenase (short-subunit alcohol dehydrogenase family)
MPSGQHREEVDIDEIRFDGRVAIVTGAGRGLGREHALLLAGRGAQVVVNDTGGEADGSGGSAAPADEVVAEIQERGHIAVANHDTVVTRQGGAAIVETALDAFGRVDILVNNAGIAAGDRDDIIDVHLRGSFNVTAAAWERMKEQGYGRILNTTSAAGLFGLADSAAYGAAKMGLVGLTRCLALDGAAHGVKVNALAPVARTRLTTTYIDDPKIQRGLERYPPALVAPVAAWLVHESVPVTGEAFSAGGGRVARVLVAETRGYRSAELSIEDLRDHFEQVLSDEETAVPRHAFDEMRLYVQW